MRDFVSDFDSKLWLGPRSLEEFETALGLGRAFAHVPLGTGVTWARLVRLGPTRHFPSGKFSVKYKVIGVAAYGWFVPADCETVDFPLIKIAPSDAAPIEDDPIAAELFGTFPVHRFREL